MPAYRKANRRIRKQEPGCLLSCRPRTWRHGEPNGAPPPKRSVIMDFVMTRKETDSPPFASDAERWAAVQRRDRDADGVFFYSVRTTGVYCRPSCAARLARRENVRFHASCEEAEAAGFRPCKRCRPNEAALAVRRAAAVAKACRLIETAEEMPNLDALAGSAGMSRFHFHRVFKTITGVTPKAYAAARRARRVREALPRSSTVTEAIYGAGFNSSGRFYAKSEQVLGMTPTRFRSGGSGAAIRFAVGECSIGSILVAATDKGVCAILLGDKPEALVRELELPLDVRGTAFQQRVWEALRRIPAGSTVTYSQIAKRIGLPSAVRAVAHACATNAIAVAIPCHRVVRNDGSLAGYRWGVERK